jgi:alkylation response protein AidB-like acyl-CoA dehydrogenase
MAVSDPALSPHGGEFILGPIPPERVFTPEEFTSEERLMAETAEKFCRGEVLPLQDRLDEKEEGLMLSLLRKAAELGLAGPDTPMEYGGLGLGSCVAARIHEMVSLNGSFAISLGVQTGIAAFPIILFGTQEQKEKYLPKLCTAEWIGAYALSEQNYGSDALNAATKAVLSDDGKHYILNGEKMWITNGGWADTYIVFAQIEGDKFSAFIVERTFPGVSVGREEHKFGMKASSTASLILEDAQVPVENVLYKIGRGHVVALNALNIGRYKLGATALGPARESLHLAAAYAKERKQFGRPICEFGLIRRKLARMTTQYFAAESILYRTGALIDSAFAQVDPSSPTLADDNASAAQEFAAECSLVKVACTQVQAYICDEAIQIHGGYGFTEEFDVGRHWRDARVSRIYEGTNEMNRLFAFNRFMKMLAKREDGARGELVRALEEELEKVAPAQPEAHRVQSVRMMLLHCAIQCVGHPDKAREQEVLADMSDLMSRLYRMETVVARASKLAADPARGQAAAAVASVYTQSAYHESLALASHVLCALGADPTKLDSYLTAEMTDVQPLHRRVAQATLDADGYPF